MGLKDTAAKNFFGRIDVLASILDYILFQGRPMVKPEQLCDLCGEHHRVLQNEDGSFRTDNRYRDKLFEYDTGDEVVTVGFEYQAYDDNKMTVRVMDYDHRRYKDLDKAGRLHRIINVVLSFDKRRRAPPTNLLQMFRRNKCVVDGLFYNYGFVSLNIYDLAAKYDQFSCKELRDVLYLFKCERDERLFTRALRNRGLTGKMSRDAAIVCAIFLGLKIGIDDESEEIDMCKAVRDYTKRCINKGIDKGLTKGKQIGIEEGKKLGLAEGERLGLEKGERLGLEKGERLGLEKGKKLGMAEGEKLGEQRTVRQLVERLFNMHLNLLDICHLTGYPEDTVQEITLSLQH